MVLRELVSIGVLGGGQRGLAYVRALEGGGVPHARLAGVLDVDERASGAHERAPFVELGAWLRSGALDALVIATPPLGHAPAALAALDAGVHVLCEKPLAPRASDCRRLVEHHTRLGSGRPVFATAYPLRADARYVELAALIRRAELGRVVRAEWTVTDCFRSDAYYREKQWRRELGGEGGGVLLNQVLHQLDLWQWLFGMPRRVQAFCRFGRGDGISIEDAVSATFEHEALLGTFVASTTEMPGTNRLEVAFDAGRAVVEGESFEIVKGSVPASELRKTAQDRGAAFPAPALRTTRKSGGLGPAALLADFVSAIREGRPPLAPAADAVAAVELANASLLAALEGRTVELPLSAARYDSAFERLLRAGG